MDECPATREAVEEAEEWGEVGCPLCGQAADEHEPEGQVFEVDGVEYLDFSPRDSDGDV